MLDDFTDCFFFGTSFYQSGQASSVNAASQQTLSKLFNKYRGQYHHSFYLGRVRLIFEISTDDPKSYPDRIGVEGISTYLEELSVRPDEVVCLGLMEQLGAPTIGEFHRDAFINGWLNVPPPPGSGSTFTPPCDTIARQAAYMKQLRTQIQTDPATFKKVYRYTFNICRPEGQRNVPAETATEMWRLFFSTENGGVNIGGNSATATPWLDWWIEFYESKYKRPVNKDLWNMFGEMMFKIQEEEQNKTDGGDVKDLKAGFGWWSEDGAWPGAVDEFVEWVVEKRKAGGAMDVS